MPVHTNAEWLVKIKAYRPRRIKGSSRLIYKDATHLNIRIHTATHSHCSCMDTADIMEKCAVLSASGTVASLCAIAPALGVRCLGSCGGA